MLMHSPMRDVNHPAAQAESTQALCFRVGSPKTIAHLPRGTAPGLLAYHVSTKFRVTDAVRWLK